MEPLFSMHMLHICTPPLKKMLQRLINNRKKDNIFFFFDMNSHPHTKAHPVNWVLPGPTSSSLLNAAQEIQVINKSLSSCLEHWPEGKGGGDGL